jgi:uncharacterized protein YqeY
MTTLATLDADILAARKARDTGRLTILTLLMSKVQRIAKDDGNRAATDDDLIQGVSRYRKEVDDMRAAMIKAGRPTDDQDAELAVVNAYLPSQLSAEELDAEIEKALEGTDRSKKAMGAVMKHLNAGFRGRFDPKAANAAVSAKLS